MSAAATLVAPSTVECPSLSVKSEVAAFSPGVVVRVPSGAVANGASIPI